jgi:hypothetical protein
MDSIELLARDLATPGVHDRLNDFTGWRRVIWRAIDGSENHRALLRGVRDDLANRAALLISGAHSAGRHSETSAAVASSTALIDFGDVAHANREVWSPEEFADGDAVAHALTITPPASIHEVPA